MTTLQHDLPCALPGIGLGVAVTETANFYARGRILTNLGYHAIWKKSRDYVSKVFGLREWLVCGGLFAATPYVAMVYTGTHISSRVQEAGIGLFLFIATLFVSRFVAGTDRSFPWEVAISIGALIFALIFSRIPGGTVGVFAFFIWYTAQAALFRYLRMPRSDPETTDGHHRALLRNSPVLHDEDVQLYQKDMLLITLIFTLAAGGYRYIMFAERINGIEVFIGAVGITIIAIWILVWELDRNHGSVGSEESVTKIVRYLGTAATESKTRSVKRAIIDHIRLRDVALLFVLVVAPFVITVLILTILPQLAGPPMVTR